MATITINTDELNAYIVYHENGFYGINITYEGKVIKKLEK